MRLLSIVLFTAAVITLSAQQEALSSSVLSVTRTDDPLPAGSCLPDDCSLREAILAANESAGETEISLPAGNYDLRLGSDWYEDAGLAGDLDILGDIRIVGSGSKSTVLTASGSAERAFDVHPGAELAISDISIRDLHIVFAPLDCGRGVRNSGTLTIERTLIANNAMRGDGGGVCNEGGTVNIIDSVISGNCACLAGRGGGIYSSGGTMSLSGTIVSDNIADWLAGGGIYSSGQLEIDRSAIVRNSTRGPLGERQGGGVFASHLSAVNSTFSGNATSSGGVRDPQGSQGGGVYVSQSGTLVNSTITNNTGDQGGAGLYLALGAFFEVVNSIVANNDGNDCDGNVVSLGYNVAGSGSCLFSASGDIMADPELGPLLPSGGSLVHPLLRSSPAVDAALPDFCPDNDQRNAERPQDGDADDDAICDIGAYEIVPSAPGDVDCDGTLSGSDAVRLLRALALIDGPICISSADADNSGSIDLGDILWILRALAP